MEEKRDDLIVDNQSEIEDVELETVETKTEEENNDNVQLDANVTGQMSMPDEVADENEEVNCFEKKKKKLFIIGGVILGTLLVIGLILILTLYVIPNSHYKKGKEAFKNEDYKLANEEFLKAKNFKDAKKQAELATKANYYDIAEEALEDEDYKEAIEYFEQAVGYKDANDKLVIVYTFTGQFDLAYKTAIDNKDDVLFQNLIAYLCKDASDRLKDPSSFEIRELWYVEEDKEIVMEIAGTNSYGGVVSSYWYYQFDEDEKMYEFYDSVDLDLEEEEYSYYDDWDERLEKTIYNLAITYVEDIVFEDKYHMDDSIVEAINLLKENEVLDSVELLEETKLKYCRDEDNV